MPEDLEGNIAKNYELIPDSLKGIDRVYTSGDVSKICGVSPHLVNKWFDKGLVKGFRIPDSRDRRYPHTALLRFMKDNRIPFKLLENYLGEYKKNSIYTTGEVARLCYVSQQTIIRSIDAGLLEGFRIPGSKFRKIMHEDLVAFMDAHTIPKDLLDEYGPSENSKDL